jgi:hypothetical protein
MALVDTATSNMAASDTYESGQGAELVNSLTGLSR